MSNPIEDPGQRFIKALGLFVQGFSLLWWSPSMLRARTYFTALHLVPLGVICHAFYPGDHDILAITAYTTAILLAKAARGGPPPSRGHIQDHSGVNSA